MGNTVGSMRANLCNFFSETKDAYILGLWCADKYWWASSIGLSNTNASLIDEFRKFFLRKHFSKQRIKLSNHHIFVNSRPLLREFLWAEQHLDRLKKREILKAYFAGRFDGDGSISQDLRSDCRIAYSNKKEAETDQKVLKRMGIFRTKIYHYRAARTFVLYVSRYQAEEFLHQLSPYLIAKSDKVIEVGSHTP